MGSVLRVFQSRKRSLMLTLLKSLVIPLLEYCMPPALESMESKRHTSYRSNSTNVCIRNHWRAALKPLGKTARTQIILPPETPWTLCDYIYFEDNTASGAKYWWYNGTQNKNQKTSKTWNTVCYSVPRQILVGKLKFICRYRQITVGVVVSFFKCFAISAFLLVVFSGRPSSLIIL